MNNRPNTQKEPHKIGNGGRTHLWNYIAENQKDTLENATHIVLPKCWGYEHPMPEENLLALIRDIEVHQQVPNSRITFEMIVHPNTLEKDKVDEIAEANKTLIEALQKKGCFFWLEEWRKIHEEERKVAEKILRANTKVYDKVMELIKTKDIKHFVEVYGVKNEVAEEYVFGEVIDAMVYMQRKKQQPSNEVGNSSTPKIEEKRSKLNVIYCSEKNIYHSIRHIIGAGAVELGYIAKSYVWNKQTSYEFKEVSPVKEVRPVEVLPQVKQHVVAEVIPPVSPIYGLYTKFDIQVRDITLTAITLGNGRAAADFFQAIYSQESTEDRKVPTLQKEQKPYNDVLIKKENSTGLKSWKSQSQRDVYLTPDNPKNYSPLLFNGYRDQSPYPAYREDLINKEAHKSSIPVPGNSNRDC